VKHKKEIKRSIRTRQRENHAKEFGSCEIEFFVRFVLFLFFLFEFGFLFRKDLSYFFLLGFLFRLFIIDVSIWIRIPSYSCYLKTYIEVLHMSYKIGVM
jgi:hypothetical protein